MIDQKLIAEAVSATTTVEREKVRAALDWLVAQPDAVRAFAVLSHPTEYGPMRSPKFVQFFTKHGGLVLDLPECALEEREQMAAPGVFGRCLRRQQGVFPALQFVCGDDVETAVELALVTFVHVFRVEPVFVVECGHTEDDGSGGGGQALPRPPIEGVLPEVTS